MPPAILFGSRWQFATDDVPIPSVFGFLLQGAYGVYFLSTRSYIQAHEAEADLRGRRALGSGRCVARGVVAWSLLGLLACFLASAALHMVTALVGVRGTVFEESRRRLVPRLLLAQVITMVTEALLLLLCTVYIPIAKVQCKEPIPGDLDSAFVATTWAILLLHVLVVVCVRLLSYVAFMEAPARIRMLSKLIQREFERSPSQLVGSAASGPCVSAHSINDAVADLEKNVLSVALAKFVPSDVLLGLILLSLQQQLQQQPRSSKRRDDYLRGSASTDNSSPQLSPLLTDSELVEPRWLEEALLASKLAMAVYGAPLYAWAARKRCGCCLLCFSTRGGCCWWRKYDAMKVQGYRMSYLPHPMHREAILLTLRLASDDLLFVSHANLIAGLLPYFLARDRERGVLVLCVRGSFSMRDLYTDMIMTMSPVDDMCSLSPARELASGTPLRVHSGVLCSAHAIIQDLEKHNLLELASSEYRDWRMEIVGHSLGGAVASVVAWLLRARFPRVHSWAIDPPGFTCNFALASRMAESGLVHSVVFADSWVPRFNGLGSVRRLLQDVEHVLARARHCKTWLLLRLGVFAGVAPCADASALAALFLPMHSLSEEASKHLQPRQEHQTQMDIDQPVLPPEDHDAYPPGCIMYVSRQTDLVASEPASTAPNYTMPIPRAGEETRYPALNRSRSSIGTHFQAHWLEARRFFHDGFKVNGNMGTDHFPDVIIKGLKKALQNSRLATPQAATTSSSAISSCHINVMVK